jgi:hypothetical protein
MACARALELDVPGFLADPGADAWATFRDHYPRCHDCAVEVRTWTELTAALTRDAHPDPETLVRFVDGDATLPPATRDGVAAHLRACVVCRDEAKTLGTFDPAAATSAASSAPPRRHAPSPATRPASRPSRLRVLWHPAVAYAAALLAVVYPLVSGRIEPREVTLAARKAKDVAAPATPSRDSPFAQAEPPASAVRAPAPARTASNEAETDLRDQALAERPAKNERKEAPKDEGQRLAKSRVEERQRQVEPPAPTTALATGRTERSDAPAADALQEGAVRGGSVAALGQARTAGPTPTTIVLSPGGEHTVAIAGDGSDVRFVVAHHRLENLRRLEPTTDRDAVVADPNPVSSDWLVPGRYVVDAVGPDGTVTRIRFRVTHP